jgi:hypothetical protein
MEPENVTTEEEAMPEEIISNEVPSEENLNENNVINSTTNIMTQQAEPDDYILENGFNLSAHFRQFNLESDRKSKESGFYVDGNLHQIL